MSEILISQSAIGAEQQLLKGYRAAVFEAAVAVAATCGETILWEAHYKVAAEQLAKPPVNESPLDRLRRVLDPHLARYQWERKEARSRLSIHQCNQRHAVVQVHVDEFPMPLGRSEDYRAKTKSVEFS